MARKRLSDLLREEAQRPDSPEPDATDLPSAEQPSPKRTPSSRGRSSTQSASKTQGMGMAQTEAQPTVESAALETNTPEPAGSEPDTPEPADPTPPVELAAELQDRETRIGELQDAIAELKTALHQSQHQEQVLRQEMESLQADLDQQQATILQLNTQLEQATHHQADLEEARSLILKLSEHNLQLSREIEQMQVSDRPQNANPASQGGAAPPAVPLATSLSSLAEPPGGEGRSPGGTMQVTKTALREILRHPIQPQQPSSTLTNDDIGWVD